MTDSMVPGEARKDLKTLERILEGERYVQYETRHRRKDGKLVTLSFKTAAVRDAQGDLLGTTGIASDITGQREVEEARRVSEARFRNLFERNLAGVYRTALDGRIIDCNESFARMLGYASRDEVRGPQRPGLLPGTRRPRRVPRATPGGGLAHEFRGAPAPQGRRRGVGPGERAPDRGRHAPGDGDRGDDGGRDRAAPGGGRPARERGVLPLPHRQRARRHHDRGRGRGHPLREPVARASARLQTPGSPGGCRLRLRPPGGRRGGAADVHGARPRVGLGLGRVPGPPPRRLVAPHGGDRQRPLEPPERRGPARAAARRHRAQGRRREPGAPAVRHPGCGQGVAADLRRDRVAGPDPRRQRAHPAPEPRGEGPLRQDLPGDHRRDDRIPRPRRALAEVRGARPRDPHGRIGDVRPGPRRRDRPHVGRGGQPPARREQRVRAHHPRGPRDHGRRAAAGEAAPHAHDVGDGLARRRRRPRGPQPALRDLGHPRRVRGPVRPARDEYAQYVSVLRGELERLSHLMGDLLEYGKPTSLEFSEGAVGDVVVEAVQGCRALADRAGVCDRVRRRARTCRACGWTAGA